MGAVLNPTAVACAECGHSRVVRYPSLAGRICRPCAAKLGSMAAASKAKDPLERLERLTDSTAGVKQCWPWLGQIQSNGYGAFFLSGRIVRAHRAAYELLVGPIPPGLEIDHLCRARACVNPAHLEPVTRLENARRAMRSHCVNRHPFTDDNVYMHGGKRYCRSCRRERARASRKGVLG